MTRKEGFNYPMLDKIIIRGAREHNLKNINLEIPRDKLVVFTGLSGSGKSSLAFDTIYADGQRRYMESLSSYARQFLGQMEKPDVDSIDGLSPAISIDQKTTSKNPRSTVGTVTEIYDYLRLLYARIGIPHCPVCGREILQQTVDQITDKVLELPEGTKLQLLAPIVRGRKGEYTKELEQAKKAGYVRVRVDGIIYDLSEKIKMNKNQKHNIEIIVDRLVVKESIRSRLADSIETTTALSDGLVLVDIIDGEEQLFSLSYACPEHGISVEELTPRMFSFNNPFGACETCTGLGVFTEFEPELLMPNKDLSIHEGGLKVIGWNWKDPKSVANMYANALHETYGVPLDTPLRDMTKEQIDLFLWGNGEEDLELHQAEEYGGATYYHPFEGLIPNLKRRYAQGGQWVKDELEEYMTEVPCPSCKGRRLKPVSLAVTVGGLDIDTLCHKSVRDLVDFFNQIQLTERELMIARLIIKEIRARLGFLQSVGLGYLTLARAAGSLSGGESQRIRLATQIGSKLVGVIYILDEPSIGLHQRDNRKLIASLKKLRDEGNTVVVVEHDEETMRAADWLVDVGPGAGALGGKLCYNGPAAEINGDSITAAYLLGKRKIEVPSVRRKGNGKFITLRGASGNNLKNIDISFPLGCFIGVAGVSGSGKSSLINETLMPILKGRFYHLKQKPLPYSGIEGIENIDKVIEIDQAPIGRSPRSNPATFTGVFDDIRKLFEETNDAKVRGFKAGRFSFNVPGGRCEECKGAGIKVVEMNFLPSVAVVCDACRGRRYKEDTLAVKYKGKNISEVLEMPVSEAYEFFKNHPKIAPKLKALLDVGLGYIHLGQSSVTLSGGESQRMKLAAELYRTATGNTLYMLDEPTTGLHFEDIKTLLDVLQKLVDQGNTVIIIEHNPDILKSVDYIFDMGPEGGRRGGLIVASGTPEQLASDPASVTGPYLADSLK